MGSATLARVAHRRHMHTQGQVVGVRVVLVVVVVVVMVVMVVVVFEVVVVEVTVEVSAVVVVVVQPLDQILMRSNVAKHFRTLNQCTYVYSRR